MAAAEDHEEVRMETFVASEILVCACVCLYFIRSGLFFFITHGRFRFASQMEGSAAGLSPWTTLCLPLLARHNAYIFFFRKFLHTPPLPTVKHTATNPPTFMARKGVKA